MADSQSMISTQALISVVCLILMAVCVAAIIVRRKKKKISKGEKL